MGQPDQNAAAPQVLLVDDEPAVRKMMGVMLSQAGISNRSAASGGEALGVLSSAAFAAVISDLRMPGMSGLELLGEVRRKHPEVAFLLATGVDDVRVGVQAMKEGADDYLVKPLQLDMVLASLHRAFEKKALQKEVDNYRRHLEEMVEERTEQLKEALAQLELGYTATLEALGTAIDLRDGPTAGHSRRVFWYSVKIAQAIGGLDEQLRNLGIGAWLHDIGKLAIPDGILLKPGALTDKEREVMRQHVQIGYDLVKRIPFLADAAEIILGHHERCDGSGYPQGLRAEQIPIGAKIFAVADSFDAMTSDRPYRSAMPFSAARAEIERHAGKLYDAEVVRAFLSISGWEAVREEAAGVPISSIINPNASRAAAGDERQGCGADYLARDNLGPPARRDARREGVACRPRQPA